MATKKRPKAKPTPRHPAPDRPGLNTILHTRTGSPITISAFIVEQIEAGAVPEHAAMAAGLSSAEFRAILREGVSALARYESGADWLTDFTPDEQDAVVFAQAIQCATGQWAVRTATILERMARGGTIRETTRIKRDGAGNEVERTVTREADKPDADLIRWRLERMFPALFGTRTQVDVSVVDLTDGEDVREVLIARLTEMAEKYANAPALPAAPIDVNATDSTPSQEDTDGPEGR